MPYREDFENVTDPTCFPADMRQQDFNDTSYYFSPSYLPFGAFPVFPNDGNSLLNNYFTDYYDLNAWAFTPGINLIAGKTYQLKFSYASYWSFDPTDKASLEVKFGKACGAAGVTSGLLFTNTDITNADELQDTIISFSPSGSGIYYFGFHDKSLFRQAALILDNISLKEDLSLRVAAHRNDVPGFETFIYPNPAHDILNLQTSSVNSGNADLIVTDVTGRIMLIEKIQLAEGTNNMQISVGDLSPAFYFIKIVNENRATNETIKFIKE